MSHLRLVRLAKYVVQVTYREPTYAEASGTERDYTWSWRIEAGSEDDARQEALAEFRKMQALSSVGWIREVVRTRVTEASAAVR